MDFEWDPNKARRNKAKHGVTFEEGAEVFGDQYSSTVADPDHSHDEERFLIFGRTRQGRYVVVAFTDRGDRIRLISARQMTRREREAYEQ
ncbi:MAG: BrnT family toxin [Gammaproteobacteria bacterium]|nr:BrnT family toxin [Gammaproteobacteria bacterium]